MELRTTVKTHDNLIGIICGKTKHGYVVKFANGKERHFLSNQVRPFDTSKVNTYTPPTPIAEELKRLAVSVQRLQDKYEKLLKESKQWNTEAKRIEANTLELMVNDLETILNKK
jgi:hypothetical protein